MDEIGRLLEKYTGDNFTQLWEIIKNNHLVPLFNYSIVKKIHNKNNSINGRY